MLTIPDVRQRKDYDCGAACVSALLSFYGREWPTVWQLANPVQGMDPATVEAVFRAAGLDVLSGAMTLADLAHFARSGRPVMCPVHTDDDGPHWVVVRGVGDMPGAGTMGAWVFHHCPTSGPIHLREADWLEVWYGLAYDGQAFDRWGIVPSQFIGDVTFRSGVSNDAH